MTTTTSAGTIVARFGLRRRRFADLAAREQRRTQDPSVEMGEADVTELDLSGGTDSPARSAQVVQLLGVGHRVDRLDLIVRDVQGHHVPT